MMGKKIIKIGVLTVSDRAFNRVYEDLSGKAIENVLSNYLIGEWESEYRIVPDEQEQIENELKRMTTDFNCCLIFTTGGTGPAKRDVTVEATENLCEKILPGFGELMRKVSLDFVPTAILSRQTAGIFNDALIINLPGKPTAIELCMKAIFPAIPYCVDLIEGPFIETNEAKIEVFRPQPKKVLGR